LGRRGADGARPAAAAARALPAPAAVALDGDDDRAADRAGPPAAYPPGVLSAVRPRLHREPDAAAGEAADVHHDGNRDLAQPAARLAPRRPQEGACRTTAARA